MLWKCLYLWLQSRSCLWTPGHSWAWRCPWNHQATRGHWGLNKSYIPIGPSKSNQRVTWWFRKSREHLIVEMISNNIYYKLPFYFFYLQKMKIYAIHRLKTISELSSLSAKIHIQIGFQISIGWVSFWQTLSLTLV